MPDQTEISVFVMAGVVGRTQSLALPPLRSEFQSEPKHLACGRRRDIPLLPSPTWGERVGAEITDIGRAPLRGAREDCECSRTSDAPSGRHYIFKTGILLLE